MHGRKMRIRKKCLRGRVYIISRPSLEYNPAHILIGRHVNDSFFSESIQNGFKK